MRLTTAKVLLFAFAILTCMRSFGEVVTKCGASSGFDYFYEGGLVKAKDSGWRKSSIEMGNILLTRAGDSYDIIFTDTMKTTSSIDDGGIIVKVIDSKPPLVLLVNYPGVSVETWVFRLDELGKGELTYSQARYNGALISKHSLLKASCDKTVTKEKR